MSRDLKVATEVKSFRDVGDKRAVKFLYESKHDVEDYEALFKPILYQDFDRNVRVKPLKDMMPELEK